MAPLGRLHHGSYRALTMVMVHSFMKRFWKLVVRILAIGSQRLERGHRMICDLVSSAFLGFGV